MFSYIIKWYFFLNEWQCQKIVFRNLATLISRKKPCRNYIDISSLGKKSVFENITSSSSIIHEKLSALLPLPPFLLEAVLDFNTRC